MCVDHRRKIAAPSSAPSGVEIAGGDILGRGQPSPCPSFGAGEIEKTEPVLLVERLDLAEALLHLMSVDNMLPRQDASEEQVPQGEAIGLEYFQGK